MDVLTAEQRKFNMSRIKGRDTKPELLIRRALHAKGFRYRLHVPDLPGRPDLVFPKFRAVILIHGCFWHGHACKLFRWPATRPDFWKGKISRNLERDHIAEQRLHELGWRTFVVWECMLRGADKLDFEELIDQCSCFLVCSDV